MELGKNFPDKNNTLHKNFKTSTVALDETDVTLDFADRLDLTQQSWMNSRISFIAQHPLAHRNMTKFEYVKYTLEYENTFLFENSTVRFKFRAQQKQNAGKLNGIFQFKLDGKPYPLQTGVLMSDTW